MKKREMKIGYSYWGFLGDCKANYKGEMLSTPDGNAFYSWSIIKAFVDAGIQVISVMPDRDKFAFASFGKKIFSAWCTDERSFAYVNMKKSDFSQYERDYRAIMKDAVFDIWNKAGLQNADAIIHEWRMKIPGRNDEVGKTLGTAHGFIYRTSSRYHAGHTCGIAHLAGAWSGACCADGRQSILTESCVSDRCGISDGSNHSHCTAVCALVRLRYLEQGAGDGTHHVFPHHHHGV